MKTIAKKLTAVVLAMVLAATALSGCAPQGGGTTPGATPTGGAPSDAKTTVTVWAFGEEGNLLSKVKDDFESKNPDLILEVLSIPWDVADEKLTAAFAGKTGPDVVQMQTHTLMNYASVGALKPLDTFVEQYPELSLDHFFEFGRDTVTYEGAQIGVPWYVEATVLFYRTDIFEEMGLSVPTTWQEMKETAIALSKRSDGMYGLGLGAANPVPGVEFLWQNEADFVKDGQAAANAAEFIEAMEFYQSFFKENLAPNADTNLMQAFIDGSCPMTLQEPWVINSLTESGEMDGKWATAKLPIGKNGLSYVGGSALVISEYTKNADAAARFVAYMSKPEIQVNWYGISKTLPSTPEAWKAPVLADDANLSVFGEQLNDGRTAPMINNFMGMVVELAGAMEKINVGNQDVAAVCSELNAKINDLLNS